MKPSTPARSAFLPTQPLTTKKRQKRPKKQVRPNQLRLSRPDKKMTSLSQKTATQTSQKLSDKEGCKWSYTQALMIDLPT